MRPSLLATIVTIGYLALSSTPPALAEEDVAANVRRLSDEYNLTIPQIAELLLAGKLSADGPLVLTRWDQDHVTIGLSLSDHVPDRVTQGSLDWLRRAFDTAHKDFDACLVSGEGKTVLWRDQPVPACGDNIIPEMVLVLSIFDGSLDEVGIVVDRPKFDRTQPLQHFWDVELNQLTGNEHQGRCGFFVSISPETAKIKRAEGITYTSMEVQDGVTEWLSCSMAMGFMLLGSLPIQPEGRGGKGIYASELLSLLYSPSLAIGMTRDDIIATLRRLAPGQP